MKARFEFSSEFLQGKRIPSHCEMCDQMFFLTVSFEGSLNRKETMNFSQLLLVAAVINELLATNLTMI